MIHNQQSEQIKSSLQQKYDYISSEDIEMCFDMALHDFIRLSYPSANKRPNAEDITLDFLTSQWIIARMEDILSREGGANVTSYKENGMSFTYASSNIDPFLASQIMPKGRVPR
jgi:hypothetical protein